MGILNQIRAAFARAAEAKTPEPVEQAVPPCPPVAPEPAATTNSERRSRQRERRKGDPALIVDDSPTVVAVLRKNLRSVGFVTHEALNGETALEIARRDRPELVFLDIVLPA